MRIQKRQETGVKVFWSEQGQCDRIGERFTRDHARRKWVVDAAKRPNELINTVFRR
jgi:hypothetical protein